MSERPSTIKLAEAIFDGYVADAVARAVKEAVTPIERITLRQQIAWMKTIMRDAEAEEITRLKDEYATYAVDAEADIRRLEEEITQLREQVSQEHAKEKEKVLQVASLMAQLAQQDEEIARLRVAQALKERDAK